MRIVDNVIKAMGKYVSVSEINVPQKPKKLKFSKPKAVRMMPFGPKQSVSAILDVKGGEISGRSVTALIKKVSHFGIDKRVTAKAKINPMIVPAKPTAHARMMLLTMARRSHQLARNGNRFSNVR